jgi:hypothetical protein
MPKFPKKLYVAYEGDGKEQYLAADIHVESFSDLNGRTVGVYVLEETVRVKTGITLEKVK